MVWYVTLHAKIDESNTVSRSRRKNTFSDADITGTVEKRKPFHAQPEVERRAVTEFT